MGGLRSAAYESGDTFRDGPREPRIFKESDVIDMENIINKARIKYRESTTDKLYLTHLN